jgi:Exopolyphosphatase-related proteins
MQDTFKSIIEKANSVLILLPTRAYFDQVASGLSLYLSLRDVKPTTVSSNSPMTVEYNRLVGVNKITPELGNKNLVIKFSDYKAAHIERVSYDIEEGQFKLTVIPKQGINPPSKDQIATTYAGVSSDTVILVGGTNESHFPQLMTKDLEGAELVHVGNKEFTLSTNKSCVSFSRPASSVAEIVYNLLIGSGFKVDEDIASNLIMGIEEETHNFTDNTLTADTFAIISELMRSGGKRTPKESGYRKPYPPGSIPGEFSQRKGSMPNKYQAPATEQPAQLAQPTQGPNGSQQDDADQNDQLQEEPPKEWQQPPKVYKGGGGGTPSSDSSSGIPTN